MKKTIIFMILWIVYNFYSHSKPGVGSYILFMVLWIVYNLYSHSRVAVGSKVRKKIIYNQKIIYSLSKDIMNSNALVFEEHKVTICIQTLEKMLQDLEKLKIGRTENKGFDYEMAALLINCRDYYLIKIEFLKKLLKVNYSPSIENHCELEETKKQHKEALSTFRFDFVNSFYNHNPSDILLFI